MGVLATWFPRLFAPRSPGAKRRPAIDTVFSLSAIPKAGYVSRTGRRDLDQIEDAITSVGKSVVILGPARIGKSVFVNKTIADKFEDRPVELSGRSVQTIDDFWMKLVLVAGGYIKEKITIADGLKGTVGGEAKLRIGTRLARASAELDASLTETVDRRVEYKRIYDLPALGREFLAHFTPVVLFEDFHEIKSDDVRREIASVAKEFGEKEHAKFVFISTSEPEVQLFRRDHQLRASIFIFPTWSNAELETIIANGFEKLLLRIGPNEQRRLIRECFGSPAILNELCLNAAKVAARRMGDTWDAGGPGRIQGSDVAEALERQVEEYRSFADIPVLALAQSTVADKPTRYEIGGAQGTVYHLILEALRKGGHAEPHGVGQEAIRNQIRELLGNKQWQSPTFSRHLAALARTDVLIEHRKLFGRLPEKPMSYDEAQQKFHVHDPTLRTYLYRGGKFHYM